MKNDLALQRLLKESHLLDPNAFKSQAASTPGRGRLKALDLRMKDLGAKESISKQRNMPQSHRRGIIAKTTDREDKRRRDAAENGVILERVKGKGQVAKQRQRSIGGPGVGKFKSGTLKLSSKDVRSITGPAPKSMRKGRQG